MRFRMRNGLVRTLVVSLIVVLLLTQKHSGFMLAFVLLLLVPWFAYSGYRCLRFPIERKLRIQKTIVWFVAVVVIVSVHLVMYRSAKSYALGVSEKIETLHFQPWPMSDQIGRCRHFKEYVQRASWVGRLLLQRPAAVSFLCKHICTV